jgi:hemolysin activation/secretion protein
MSRIWRAPLRCRPVAIAWVLMLGCAQSAIAQQVAPAEVNPGQVQRRIPTPAEPQQPPGPLTLPAIGPVAPQVPVKFVLTGVEIEGVSVFEVASLAPLYEDFLAREVGIGDVEEILRRITAKYRDSGYFLSRANAEPQDLESGVLRIAVIEGSIQRVSFPGMAEAEAEPLRRYMTAVLAERPSRLSTLERAILSISDLPDLSVTPELRPLDEKAHTFELVLAIARKGYSGVVSVDNRGTRSLGPVEAQAVGGLDSVLAPFDRLSLNLFTVPNRPRELLSEQLSYDLPLAHDGTRMEVVAARTDLHPRGNLAFLGLSGDATHFGAGVTHPLLRTRDQSIWAGGTIDAEESEQSQKGVRQFDDQLRVLRLHGLYLSADSWGGSNSLALEASQGLDILGSSRPGASDLSRSNGRPDFTKATGIAVRLQHLLGDWYFRLAASGQIAAQPLLISEQFALGGAQFGRAYDPGEIVGDDGAAGSAELRYVGVVQNSFVRTYEIYGFYDFGMVWNIDARNATGRQSLASTGVGVRVALEHNLNFTLEIARPLTRTVAAEAGKPVRAFASLSLGF